ncbi:MAG: DUF1800 family protein, partial [Acidobacteriota bacterium]
DLADRLARVRRLPGRAGFVIEEDFLFRADVHDADPKRVLGRMLPRGRGIEDGVDVLDRLAAHPATARHLAHKLAVRFVADAPPSDLVDDVAAAFRRTQGDLRATVRTLAHHPAFWHRDTVRSAKIKTPFELVTSAARALDADVRATHGLADWTARMGQRLYAWEAPTGWPDRADAWVNAGALLQRMNFGLSFAAGRVLGVRFDLAALLDGREPASRDEALDRYAAQLMPAREAALSDALAPLRRLVHAPAKMAEALDAQAGAATAADGDNNPRAVDFFDDDSDEPPLFADGFDGEEHAHARGRPGDGTVRAESGAAAHVVGVLLGSPPFQRR